MRTFDCSIDGNTLYFENSVCVECRHEVGWCPACESLDAIVAVDGQTYRCSNVQCGALLRKCDNYRLHDVCNRCLAVEGEPAPATALCDYCRLNEIIPDLSIEANRPLWGRLEVAKRRLLYTLDLLGLPYGAAEDAFPLPLSFSFMADAISAEGGWRSMGGEQVYTGHADGTITLNIREADPAERERLRVDLGEEHRTLLGHFRHEIGHYYWLLLVQDDPQRRDEFTRLFGDHQSPSYADAMKAHRDSGAPAGWQDTHISAYATMHPWEDFAETFSAYLAQVSVLDTARHAGLGPGLDVKQAEFSEMRREYERVGVTLNEMNRAMGLLDLVPQVFTPVIVAKIEFVHRLVRAARR